MISLHYCDRLWIRLKVILKLLKNIPATIFLYVMFDAKLEMLETISFVNSSTTYLASHRYVTSFFRPLGIRVLVYQFLSQIEHLLS